MRPIFGKYWYLYVIAFVLILSCAIAVQVFKATNWLAAWFFNFVNDWAVALSASAAVILIITAFMAIRENRRTRALDRICNWASNTITLLTAPSTEELPLLKEAELKAKLRAIIAGSIRILADSKQISRELNEKVEKTVSSILDHSDALSKNDTSFDFKGKAQALSGELTEVINCASKL